MKTLNIPEGYKYCAECELLTPHTLKEDMWECDICSYSPIGYYLCPNCQWEHDPDRDLQPESIDVKKHTEQCFKKQLEEVKKDAKNKKDGWDMEVIFNKRVEEKCDCPTVTCYTISNCYNYSQWSPASLDCYNALEWEYEVMCPICNEIFEVQDGNC